MNVGDVVYSDKYAMAWVSIEFIQLCDLVHAGSIGARYEYLDEGMMIVIATMGAWFTAYFPKMHRYVYVHARDKSPGIRRVVRASAST